MCVYSLQVCHRSWRETTNLVIITSVLVHHFRSNVLNHYKGAVQYLLKLRTQLTAYLLIKIYFTSIIKALITVCLSNTMRT